MWCSNLMNFIDEEHASSKNETVNRCHLAQEHAVPVQNNAVKIVFYTLPLLDPVKCKRIRLTFALCIRKP